MIIRSRLMSQYLNFKDIGSYMQFLRKLRRMCTCNYCVLYCLYFFVLFRLCIFILICFVCTGVRTTANEWKFHCSNNNNNSEISAMCNQNAAQVIPIVISSTAVIPKSLSQSLKRLNLHPNTYIQMQKSVILGTCSTVRNFLNYK